jgi:hypothetical protein
LYQQLLSGAVSYKELCNRIIKRIKAAHAFRHIEQVRESSSILVNIPIEEHQLIGQYYLYWCRYRNREYEIATLESIIDHTQAYKARGLLSRGALEYDHSRNQEALYFFTEALRAGPGVSEYIAISIAIAVAKATEGFHLTRMTQKGHVQTAGACLARPRPRSGSGALGRLTLNSQAESYQKTRWARVRPSNTCTNYLLTA